MKIFLFGATGSTGFEVLKQLVGNVHTVKALARNPTKLNLTKITEVHEGQIEPIKGNVFEPDTFREDLRGCDVVISALGTGKDNSYTEIYSRGGRNILSAMRSAGIKRLITITSGLIDMSDPSTDNFLLNRIIRPNFNKIYYDQTRWETVTDDTEDINWTVIRPKYLTNKARTGTYRVQSKHCPKGGRKIGRTDLAEFIVKQIHSNEFIHQKPVIAY